MLEVGEISRGYIDESFDLEYIALTDFSKWVDFTLQMGIE